MADIKTKETVKSYIKTIDKSKIAADHMKESYAKTKGRVESQISTEDESPIEYASNRYTEHSSEYVQKLRKPASIIKDKSVEITKENISHMKNADYAKKIFIDRRKNERIIKTRESIKQTQGDGEIKTKENLVFNEKKRNLKHGKASIKFNDKHKIKATEVSKRRIKEHNYQKMLKERFEKKAKEKAAKGSKKSFDNLKKAVKKLYQGAKVVINTAKALVAGLIALGWVGIIIVLVCCLFGAAYYLFGDSSSNYYTEVSKEVEAYTPVITKYAKQYGIGEYVELIKAVMMQESAGKGNDPMQASESPFNKKYSHSPNSITSPEYSIECGVQAVKSALNEAGVKDPLDMSHIRLALQGYNYGNGYISWAKKRDGGYTVENASEFSEQMKKKLGTSVYGDKQYVTHVLRYYPYGNYNVGVGNGVITQVANKQVGNVGGKPYWSWYGFPNHVEWCACYVSWCADQCGYIKSGTIPKFASVSQGIKWFKDRGQWQRKDYRPKSGDIIFFDWEPDGSPDHVGIVEKSDAKYVYTIEGNSQDRCQKHKYSIGSTLIFGYGVPKY